MCITGGAMPESPSMAKTLQWLITGATGLEAVMGYLYLKDDFERVVSLTKLGVELCGTGNIAHKIRGKYG